MMFYQGSRLFGSWQDVFEATKMNVGQSKKLQKLGRYEELHALMLYMTFQIPRHAGS